MGWKQWGVGLAISIGLVSPLFLYAQALYRRPPQTNVQRSLFQGIDYQRLYRDSPRPHLIHIVRVDLRAPGVEVFVTPGHINPVLGTDTQAQTTSEFLHRHHLQLAINAGFFKPFQEQTPWSFSPRSGQPTDVLGTYISEGNRYSWHPTQWPKLCFTDRQKVFIRVESACPDNTVNAVAGNVALYPFSASDTKKQRAFKVPIDQAYPRTVGGVSEDGSTLWLIVIDGKQPGYSEGLKLAEVEHLLAELEIDQSVNLDGGGSVTLVHDTPDGTSVMNAPIHTKWPMMERPIATHLGFRAFPSVVYRNGKAQK